MTLFAHSAQIYSVGGQWIGKDHGACVLESVGERRRVFGYNFGGGKAAYGIPCIAQILCKIFQTLIATDYCEFYI